MSTEQLTVNQMMQEIHLLTVNNLLARQTLMERMSDPRRNIEKECGYPESTEEITISKLKFMYDREPIAGRVVRMEPNESWKLEPCVYEIEEEDTETEFEKAFKDLSGRILSHTVNSSNHDSTFESNESHPLWTVLKRADILSGIGSFGIILIGYADGQTLDKPAFEVEDTPKQLEVGTKPETIMDSKQQPIEDPLLKLITEPESVIPELPTKGTKAKKAAVKVDPNKLLYLRVFDESLVTVTSTENNKNSPRYGMPVHYSINMNSTTSTSANASIQGNITENVKVHWTRVVHIVDNAESSEVYGIPRMRECYNRLYDLYKTYGGSAEMYWQGAFPGMSIETHPSLGVDVVMDKAAINEAMENYRNHMQRHLALSGVGVNMLAPTVVDPTAQITAYLTAICIAKGYPMRVFMGSERGELASSQDAKAFEERMDERRKHHVTPNLIVPIVERFIQLGILPTPKQWMVKWQKKDSASKVERATVAKTIVEAMAGYLQGNCQDLMQPLDFLTKVLEFSTKEAEAILKAAEEYIADNMPEDDTDPLLDVFPVASKQNLQIPPNSKTTNLPGEQRNNSTVPPQGSNKAVAGKAQSNGK